MPWFKLVILDFLFRCAFLFLCPPPLSHSLVCFFIPLSDAPQFLLLSSGDAISLLHSSMYSRVDMPVDWKQNYYQCTVVWRSPRHFESLPLHHIKVHTIFGTVMNDRLIECTYASLSDRHASNTSNVVNKKWTQPVCINGLLIWKMIIIYRMRKNTSRNSRQAKHKIRIGWKRWIGVLWMDESIEANAFSHAYNTRGYEKEINGKFVSCGSTSSEWINRSKHLTEIVWTGHCLRMSLRLSIAPTLFIAQ